MLLLVYPGVEFQLYGHSRSGCYLRDEPALVLLARKQRHVAFVAFIINPIQNIGITSTHGDYTCDDDADFHLSKTPAGVHLDDRTIECDCGLGLASGRNDLVRYHTCESSGFELKQTIKDGLTFASLPPPLGTRSLQVFG